MKKYFAAAALLVTMAACGSAAQDKTLEGTTWKLAKMESIPATAINQETDFFTLEFNAADTMVAGRTNCNRFFGRYELKGKKLEFENMGMTRMACPDMQYEDAFVKMLDDVDRFEIKGSELTFFDDDKSLAVFKAVEKVVSPARIICGTPSLRGCRFFCVMRRNCSVGRMCGICCGRRK